MANFQSQFDRILHDQVKGRIDVKTEELGGYAAQDHADYSYRCGYIAALRDVLTYGEDIRRKLQEG